LGERGEKKRGIADQGVAVLAVHCGREGGDKFIPSPGDGLSCPSGRIAAEGAEGARGNQEKKGTIKQSDTGSNGTNSARAAKDVGGCIH